MIKTRSIPRFPNSAPVTRTSAYWIRRAIKLYGSQEAVAKAAGCTQQAISYAKRGQVSAELALAIHRGTHGVISAHRIRPDLWTCIEHVPVLPPPVIVPTEIRGAS